MIKSYKTRENWLDFLKAFAMFLVVWGHTTGKLRGFIYSFHMPLFFMISGYLVEEKLKKDFIREKFKRLIKPYFLYSLILIMIGKSLYFILGKKSIALKELILGMLYGVNIKNYLDYREPLWFLLCLFVVFLIYDLFYKFEIKILSMFISLILGMYFYYKVNYRMPWNFEVAFQGYIYFYIGYMINQKKITKQNKTKQNKIMLICVCIFPISYIYNGTIAMDKEFFNNYILSIVTAISVSLFLFLFFKRFFIRNNRFISFFSRNTIIVLVFHRLLDNAFVIVLRKIEVDYTKLSVVFLRVIFQIIIILYLIYAKEKIINYGKKYIDFKCRKTC